MRVFLFSFFISNSVFCIANSMEWNWICCLSNVAKQVSSVWKIIQRFYCQSEEVKRVCVCIDLTTEKEKYNFCRSNRMEILRGIGDDLIISTFCYSFACHDMQWIELFKSDYSQCACDLFHPSFLSSSTSSVTFAAHSRACHRFTEKFDIRRKSPFVIIRSMEFYADALRCCCFFLLI